MDLQISIIKKRLSKVINGDKAGISEDVGWKGGDDVVFIEMTELNQKYRKRILKAKKSELKDIWNEIKENGFLSWQVDIKKIDRNANEFFDLKKKDMQKFLLDVLDNNHLYVNYSDIDDSRYKIKKSDKKLNKEFYGK